MVFWSAVKSVFGKYATFQGRACRSEYWYFYLFDVIVFLIAGIVDLAIFGYDVNVVSSIWALATFIPAIAVAVRRLHAQSADTQRLDRACPLGSNDGIRAAKDMSTVPFETSIDRPFVRDSIG